MRLFTGKNKMLMSNIDSFLQLIGDSSTYFHKALESYLSSDENTFTEYLKKVSVIEHEADELLKKVKHDLYAFMLIPDTRADVFRFINDLDNIIDSSKQLLVQLSIQRPLFSPSLSDGIISLVTVNCESMEALIETASVFFRQPSLVENRALAVIRCEEKVDAIGERIEREIFSLESSYSLSEKMQLSQFNRQICSLSDLAEDIARDLIIFALKRMV